MSIAYIIGAVIAAILAYFGIGHYKNKKALKNNHEAREEISELEGQLFQILEGMEEERVKLDEMKKAYEEKIGRELTDEEIANLFNSRYNKQ